MSLNGPLVAAPGDDQSLAAAMRFLQKAIGMDMENCLPARVESYDRARNIATVRPMIMVTTRSTTGNRLNRDPRVAIPDIPVLSLGGGLYHISFPLEEGDLGWIYACDRDITLFLQNLEQQPAGLDGPSHKFSDAIFIPDVFRKYTINAEDEGAMVIQSTNSATRISIRQDNIKITAPVKVLLEVPDTEMTGNLTVQQNVVVNGDTLLNKNVIVTGPGCTLPAGTTVGGATVLNHDHENTVPPFQ